jgi:hypothetical protein
MQTREQYENYKTIKSDYINLRTDEARTKFREKLLEFYTYADVSSKKTSYPVSEAFKKINKKGNNHTENNSNGPLENYSITYGEVKYEGAKILLDFIEKNNIEFFADIGSGCSKLPIFIGSAKSIKLSYGIEIVEERLQKGKTILDSMSKYLNDTFGKGIDFTNNITLVAGDMFDIDYKKLVDNKKALIFISNLCFGDKITTNLYRKLVSELPSKTFILSSSAPSDENIKEFELVRYNNESFGIKDGRYNIPMSWDSSSKVNFFLTK